MSEVRSGWTTNEVTVSELPHVHDGLIKAVRLLAHLARVAEQTCHSERVSLPQYRLLLAASCQPRRPSELAVTIGVTRPTLTSLVDGLEQVDYLRRIRLASDRRGVRLEVTPEGHEAVGRVERALVFRMLELIEGDHHQAMEAVGGVIAGVLASLDREGRALVA